MSFVSDSVGEALNKAFELNEETLSKALFLGKLIVIDWSMQLRIVAAPADVHEQICVEPEQFSILMGNRYWEVRTELDYQLILIYILSKIFSNKCWSFVHNSQKNHSIINWFFRG